MRFPFQRGREISFESVRQDRAGEVADLHAKCFEREWGTLEFSSLLAQANVICVVAREVGKPFESPLAFVLARYVDDEAEILSIGVDPRHRKNGIGRTLMEEIIRKLHAERTSSLFLEVDAVNTSAVNMYRNMKFREVGERPSYYGNDAGEKSAALVMRLDLV